MIVEWLDQSAADQPREHPIAQRARQGVVAAQVHEPGEVARRRGGAALER